MLELVFSQVGPWVLLVGSWAVGAYAVIRWLVPKSFLHEQQRINSRVWEAYQRECDAHDETRKQNAELLELSRTSARVLTAPVASTGVGTGPVAPEGGGGNAPAVA